MQTINSASLGIVLPGAGTRSGYQTGAMIRLAEQGVVPKVVVASSGGAAAGIFPLGKRNREMAEWAWRFDDPRFISWTRLKNGPIMDIDFLVDGIFAEQAPRLEYEVAQSPTKYFVAVTRFPDGMLHWFSRETGEPLFDQLRATKTMPGVSRHFVDIAGVHYADGCLSASVEDCIDKAFEEGATEVLVIDNSVYGRLSMFTRNLMRYGVRHAPCYVQAVVESFCSKLTKPVECRPDVYLCRAKNLPTKHGLVRSHRINRRTVEQGYIDAAKLVFT